MAEIEKRRMAGGGKSVGNRKRSQACGRWTNNTRHVSNHPRVNQSELDKWKKRFINVSMNMKMTTRRAPTTESNLPNLSPGNTKKVIGLSAFRHRIPAMEISGIAFRQVPFVSGAAGIDAQSSKSSVDFGHRFPAFAELRVLGSRDSRVAVRPRNLSGFRDKSHLKYYYESPMCAAKKEKVSPKKKMKLLKSLSKDLSMLSDLGFVVDSDQGLAGEVKGKMMKEATEVLMKQLQQMRAEEKELKRKRKEEKARMKAASMKTMGVGESSSSSSSESSDSECGEVVDMTHLRSEADMEAIKGIESEPPALQEPKILEEPSSPQTVMAIAVEQEEKKRQIVMGGEVAGGEKRIQVCMGGKCRKSGAEALLQEFERAVGVEGAVVGCKCMGKCRDGPNVRVLNNSSSIVGSEAQGLDDSVRTPTNPLCIGVGLQDVGIIVSNFFGQTHEEEEQHIAIPAPA